MVGEAHTPVVPAAALAATGSDSPAAAKTVNGTVGPGFTIGTTMQGKKVTKLKAGTAYRVVIRPRGHSRLPPKRARLNRVLTSVEFTGTKSFVLRLKKRSYRFVWDPHSGIMHSSFKVS
jgi:hypothetical protein